MMLRILAVLFCIIAPFARAETNVSDPKSVVEAIFQKAAEAKVAKDSALQEEINRNVDFSQMASAVLGSESKKSSAADIAWFQKTLKEIITRTVYPEAPKFLNSVKIGYKDVKVEGARAKVSSVVRNKGESTDVEYVLAQTPAGWRVVDVSIDGESWVQTISEQVHKTLQKSQWNGLKAKLNKRLAGLRSGKKVNAKDDKEV